MYIAGGRIESIRRIVCTVLEAAGACIIIADDMRASSSCLCLTTPPPRHQTHSANTHVPSPLPPSTTSYTHIAFACYHRPCRHPRHPNSPHHSPIRPAAASLSLPAATLAIATHLATARRDRLNCKRRTEAAHRHRNARPHIRRWSGRLPVRARPSSAGFRA
jgi:hypothetical protein